jgi:O-acetylhomoserine/O-acetylserine sulfhydrylase-like pyridoxal-dependent enzyme
MERCGINYSQIVNPTSNALVKIFDTVGEGGATQKLQAANAAFQRRMTKYASRADATRESMLRAILAARVTEEQPTVTGTP